MQNSRSAPQCPSPSPGIIQDRACPTPFWKLLPTLSGAWFDPVLQQSDAVPGWCCCCCCHCCHCCGCCYCCCWWGRRCCCCCSTWSPSKSHTLMSSTRVASAVEIRVWEWLLLSADPFFPSSFFPLQNLFFYETWSLHMFRECPVMLWCVYVRMFKRWCLSVCLLTYHVVRDENIPNAFFWTFKICSALLLCLVTPMLNARVLLIKCDLIFLPNINTPCSAHDPAPFIADTMDTERPTSCLMLVRGNWSKPDKIPKETLGEVVCSYQIAWLNY